MRALLVLFIFSGIVLLSCRGPEPAHGPPMIESLESFVGGPDAWEDMPRYLRFDFRLEFNGNEFLFSENLWDRWEGRYRTRWRSAFEEGERLGLVDLDESGGNVWIDGVPAPEDQREELLAAARYRAGNDSYWLIAPLKLRDPGARLVDEGMQDDSMGVFHRVHLTFGDSVGTTPGDQFWLSISEPDGRLDHWSFVLESFEGAPSLNQASMWRWEDWEDMGGVRLARTRTLIDSPQFPQFTTGRIDFPVVRFLDEVDDRVFADPEWPVP